MIIVVLMILNSFGFGFGSVSKASLGSSVGFPFLPNRPNCSGFITNSLRGLSRRSVAVAADASSHFTPT